MACSTGDCTDVATACANSASEPLGTTSAEALACNASTIDKVVNGSVSVTTRTGNSLLSLEQLQDLFGFGVAPFTFTTGGTLESINLLVSNDPVDGFYYHYIGSSANIPLVIAPGFDPTASPDWEAFTATVHNLSSGRGDYGAHDSIYSRKVSKSEMSTGTFTEGDIVMVTDRDNYLFLFTAPQANNGYMIIEATASVLSAELLPNSGAISYSSAGYDKNAVSQNAFNAALTDYLSTRNVSLIFDSDSGNLASTNSTGDLQGKKVDLNGNEYRFSPANTGGIYNGKAVLKDSWINGAPNTISKNRDLDSIYRSSPPVLAGKNRFPIEVAESDVSVGGQLNTWRKCDGSKYWILETIVTQQPSGLGTSIDVLCPAWRLGTLSMCDFVQAYRYTPSVIAAGDGEFTTVNPGTGNSNRVIKYRQTNGAAAFYEYELTSVSNTIGIMFLTTVTACETITIEVLDVTGRVVSTLLTNNFGAATDLIKVVAIDSGVQDEAVTVRITNTSGGFMRICGVGCVVENSVTCSNIDYVTFSAFTTGDKKVRSSFNGAMDYAIMEENLLKFGGESHGGEIMSQQDILLDGELITPITTDYYVATELRIDQESLTTFPSTAAFSTNSKHRFYSYPAAHDYSAAHSFTDGFEARIAYGPMLTTHSQMDTMILPEVIKSQPDGFSGSDERYEFGKTEYVRLESTVNPFINEMWIGTFSGQYNESTPWWKIGVNANDSRKFYYGPVSSVSCGSKDMSKQPYSTRSVRVYN